MYKPFIPVSIFILFFLLASCSASKYLSPGEQLYTGATVKITSEDYKAPKALKEEVEEVLSPTPNKKFLGMRLGLWIYNIAGEPTGKGIRYWLKNKLGEAPVLYNERYNERVKQLIGNRLENNGHFRSTVTVTEKERKKDKYMSLLYEAAIHPPYLIQSIHYPDDSTKAIDRILYGLKKEALLEIGKPYNLEVMKKERERLNNALKKAGYYFFSDKYLLFEADTTVGTRDSATAYQPAVSLYLKVKEDAPNKSLYPYTIHDIDIFTDYDIEAADSTRRLDTLTYQDFQLIAPEINYRPALFERSILLDTGRRYAQEAHQSSVRKLSDLGTFKFVNIKFEADTSANHYLDANVLLTPIPRRSLSVELTAATQSNGFFTPDIKITETNRNLFRGAEQFSITLEGGLQRQFSTQSTIDYIWWLGAGVELTFPYLLVPFNIENSYNKFNFYTRIKPFYRRITYSPLLTTNVLDLEFGYEWKETLAKSHQLNPLVITYQNSILNNETVEADIENQLVANSLEQQFVVAAQYNYTYNDLLKGEKRSNFYFRGSVETAGNALNLIYRAANAPVDEGQPYELLGVPFAQYARFGTEFRYYQRLSKKTKLVNRLLVNVGLPYGNSRVLPFFKQYAIGGPNSIRAFPVRSVGPGIFRDENSSLETTFVQSAGDIRLEANTEYRFDITSAVKGALFVDAGNVWLANRDTERPGGVFEWDRFYEQLAIGTGAGIRLDVSFIVVRFDVGVALRRPADWVIQNIDFTDRSWRRDNLTYNLAIGYPF